MSKVLLISRFGILNPLRLSNLILLFKKKIHWIFCRIQESANGNWEKTQRILIGKALLAQIYFFFLINWYLQFFHSWFNMKDSNTDLPVYTMSRSHNPLLADNWTSTMMLAIIPHGHLVRKSFDTYRFTTNNFVAKLAFAYSD